MSNRIERIFILVLVLGAFWLRAFRLDVQSIWSDEGLSLFRSSQDLSAITSLSAAGIHPPFYEMLLHFWGILVGRTEFSVRFLSVFFGVLAVAALYQLGRSTISRWGAVLAALVASVAPFLVHYSQETRMYAPALLFSMVSVIAAIRWMRGPRSWVWLACYTAAMAAAAYSHYYAWLITAFLNIFILLRLWTQGRAAWTRLTAWILAQVALGLIYLPWAGVLLNKYETYLTPSAGASLQSILYQTAVSFGLGYSAGQAGATPGQVDLFPDHWVVLSLAVAFALIVFWGIQSGGRAQEKGTNPPGRFFLSLYLILPVIIIVLLSWGKRDFAPRYLIFASPAYYLLIGHGLASLLGTRKVLLTGVGVAALIMVLGASALSLRNYYYDPAYWRDDMRGVAELISSRSRDGDVVVLNAYYLDPTFKYYYRGNAPVVGLPSPQLGGRDGVLANLEPIARQHDRLWLVLWQNYYSDPDGLVQGMLDETSFPFFDERFRGGINVIGYLNRPPVQTALPSGQPVNLKLGGSVELVAYQSPSEPLCAGSEVAYTLYWRALRPLSTDYSVFVHLLDADEKIWSNGDSQPVGGGYPTSFWPVESVVTDERRLKIPGDTPPGQYYLEAGMYDLTTMKRLGEGDPEPFQANLGPWQVLPAGCK